MHSPAVWAFNPTTNQRPVEAIAFIKTDMFRMAYTTSILSECRAITVRYLLMLFVTRDLRLLGMKTMTHSI